MHHFISTSNDHKAAVKKSGGKVRFVLLQTKSQLISCLSIIIRKAVLSIDESNTSLVCLSQSLSTISDTFLGRHSKKVYIKVSSKYTNI